MEQEISKYEGLRGWLIVIIVIIFFGLSMDIFSLYAAIVEYIANEYASQSRFIWDVLAPTLLALLSFYLIFLFFTKNKKFPETFIAIFILASAINAINFILMEAYDEPTQLETKIGFKIVARSIAWIAVFYLYMKKSKRVSATFTRG